MRTASVDFAAPIDVVFHYLADPINRPQWQSSLRHTVDVDGDGSVGTTWTDVTAAGIRPRMRVTEVDPRRAWAEVGTWRGIDAELRLDFAAHATGTTVSATVAFTTPVSLRPVGWLLAVVAPYAVRSDLRRAARVVGRGS